MIFARLTQRWHALRYWRARQFPPRLAPSGAPAHARFEQATFSAAYRDAVHGDAGLALWQHDSEHGRFALRLQATPRANPEGELTLFLMADGAILHRLSWIWADGAQFGAQSGAQSGVHFGAQSGAGFDMRSGAPPPVVPFVTANAGLWRDAGAAFDAFERAFPNNSPSFFTFAALQGAAGALGIDRIIALRATAHPLYEAAQHAAFDSAYDGFWRILGGAETDARTCTIMLPFYLKPLQDMPSKHRKRAAQRREHWRAVGEAARSTLLRHMASVEAVSDSTEQAPQTAKA